MAAMTYKGPVINLKVGQRVVRQNYATLQWERAEVVRVAPSHAMIRCVDKDQWGDRIERSIRAEEIRDQRVKVSGPGPCKHCAPFDGLVRTKEGIALQCKQCFGGYL